MEVTHGLTIWQQLFTAPGYQIEAWAHVVRALLRIGIGIGFILTIVPGLIWLERRLLSWVQGRLGPNRVGWQGLAQPIADGIKLFFKEDIIPTNVDKTLYIMAPAIALAPVLMSVAVLPWNGSPNWGTVAPGLNIGILFLLAIASIEVYGVILAGWSSNNKYSLLGGLRASSQVISYELGMGFSIIAVILMTGTLVTQDIVNQQGLIQTVPIGNTGYTVYEHAWNSGFWDFTWLQLFPFGLIAAFVYLVSMVAETNRAPFDLPEAETELVAGFHTEYSSMKFAMFFMGEYANMLIVSAIAITLFFGGWLAPFGFMSQIPASAGAFLPAWLINTLNMAVIAPFWFGIKLFTLICFFILLRASFPRLRYDMLMKFGWKGILPVGIANVALIALSLAFQQQYGRYIGHGLAVAVGAAFLALLFVIKMATYGAKRRAASAAAAGTDLVPVAPVRRAPVAVSVPAAQPAQEV
jgi:NADH-quinone oxidoreductase subunit H